MSQDSKQKLCIFYNEWVPVDAIVCPECGEYLPRKAAKQEKKEEPWKGMIHEF